MNVILSGIVGSTAYGLNHAGSDVDFLGIFAAPTHAFHGLRPPAASYVTANPDKTLHEAGKAARLMLACNPTVLELLWLPASTYEIITPHGWELLDIRRAFLSAGRVRNAYFGYADAQLQRLRNRGDGSFSSDTRKRALKHARHLVRLMLQGQELLRTGELTLRLERPDQVRAQADTIVQNPDFGASLLAAARENTRDVQALPERPDEDRVERWLQALRKTYYRAELV